MHEVFITGWIEIIREDSTPLLCSRYSERPHTSKDIGDYVFGLEFVDESLVFVMQP